MLLHQATHVMLSQASKEEEEEWQQEGHTGDEVDIQRSYKGVVAS